MTSDDRDGGISSQTLATAVDLIRSVSRDAVDLGSTVYERTMLAAVMVQTAVEMEAVAAQRAHTKALEEAAESLAIQLADIGTNVR